MKGSKNCFAFGLRDLEVLKGQQVWIYLVDDAPIFFKAYMYSEINRELINARTKDLSNAHLVEFSDEEYASTIKMPSKKDLFGSCIEKQMCGD